MRVPLDSAIKSCVYKGTILFLSSRLWASVKVQKRNCIVGLFNDFSEDDVTKLLLKGYCL
jgi:hypothetical protein